MTNATLHRPSPLLAAAQALATDAVTAEVVSAWEEAGVPSLLCKGPTVADWLYDERRVRTYGDSDLFVAPHAIARARKVLVELGFVERPYEDPRISTHATPWLRVGDGAQVDLHHALWGSSAPPRRQWELLRDGYTESMRVGGIPVTVPTPPARALFVATHAAQHGRRREEKPQEDLRRALAIASEDVWRDAARLADQLGSVGAMASGLSQHPAGAELARRLPYTRTWLVGHGGSRTVAVGFERVAHEPGARARAALTLRTLFPPPDVLRWWSPLARRGHRGLAAAYGLRLARLSMRAAPSLASWYRARPPRAR